MNVKSKETVENSAVELIIQVDAQEFEAGLDKVYKKQRNSIALPGFRKGKAPRKMVEKMYGANVFYEDAIEELYPTAFAQAVEQENLDIVAYPKMEIVEVGAEGFTFKAIVTVRPEATIGEYKGLEIAKTEIVVTDEDVDTEMKPFLQRATNLLTVEREAQMGDTVVMDFEGFDNGVPFQGGKGENHSLELGSGSFVPGFEEGMVGLKAGDEKDLDITFPEEYHAELAGKAVVFKVRVISVKEAVTPEIDDEFAKDVSEFETLAEFKADLSQKITTRREEDAKKAEEDAMVDGLLAVLEMDVPEAMIDYRADQMVQDYAQRITSQGIPFEQFLQMTGQTTEMMKEQSKVSADRMIRYEGAIDAIAKAEAIQITEEDMNGEYQELATKYEMELEKVKELADAEDVKSTLIRRKAMALVKANIKTV